MEGVGNRFGSRGERFAETNAGTIKKTSTHAMKTKRKQKVWTFEETEIELPNYYLRLDWSVERLAEHFRCSKAEIRRKLKEIGAWVE